MINYGLTVSMKNVCQHATQLKIVFADKVFVSTIELTYIIDTAVSVIICQACLLELVLSFDCKKVKCMF